MRLHENLLKCVAFIGHESSGKHIEDGTGFFGTCTINGVRTTYFITARHVIKPMEDGSFSIRMNLKSGESKWFDFDDGRWYYHADEQAVDIAITAYTPPETADIIPYELDIQTDEEMRAKRITAGNPTYIVGMLNLLRGQKRMLPVVHVGHIAVLPGDEKIPATDSITRRQTELFGYVVQAQTLDGLSGVDVHPELTHFWG